MKKIKHCKGCGNKKSEEIKCDTCGKLLIYPIITLDICDELYDFCCLNCLLKFVIEELNKLNPRNDIITGGKKCIKSY